MLKVFVFIHSTWPLHNTEIRIKWCFSFSWGTLPFYSSPISVVSPPQSLCWFLFLNSFMSLAISWGSSSTCFSLFFFCWSKLFIWTRKWQPTPVFLPGKSHGQRNLTGYSPWGHKESDTTVWLTQQFILIVKCYLYALMTSWWLPWWLIFNPDFFNSRSIFLSTRHLHLSISETLQVQI